MIAAVPRPAAVANTIRHATPPSAAYCDPQSAVQDEPDPTNSHKMLRRDTLIFRAYIEHFLVPTLRPGDIVVTATNFRSRWDNLAAHKVEGVREAIEAAGATSRPTRPIPAFARTSLNPIEQLFAKLKAPLRRAAERSIEALWNRIGNLLDAFSPQSAPTTSETRGMMQVKCKML